MKYFDKNLSLPEIFERVSKLETIDEKATLLAQYDRADLRWVVDFMYNADKTGLYIPTYKPSTSIKGHAYMTIKTSLAKIEAALNNKGNEKVYERNLTVVLENVMAAEAELLCDLLTGKKIQGISKQVFKKVYPSFFPVED